MSCLLISFSYRSTIAPDATSGHSWLTTSEGTHFLHRSSLVRACSSSASDLPQHFSSPSIGIYGADEIKSLFCPEKSRHEQHNFSNSGVSSLLISWFNGNLLWFGAAGFYFDYVGPIPEIFVSTPLWGVYREASLSTISVLSSLNLVTVVKLCFDSGPPAFIYTPDELICCVGFFPDAKICQSTLSRRDSIIEPKPLYSQSLLQLRSFIALLLRLYLCPVGGILCCEEDNVCLLLMVRHLSTLDMGTIYSTLMFNLLKICLPSDAIYLGVAIIDFFFRPRTMASVLTLSPDTINHQPLISECNISCSNGGQVDTTCSKPSLLCSSFTDCRGLDIGFSVLAKLSSPIRSIVILVGAHPYLISYCEWCDSGLDLSLDGLKSWTVVVVFVQSCKLRHFLAVTGSQACILTLPSGDVYVLQVTTLSITHHVPIPVVYSRGNALSLPPLGHQGYVIGFNLYYGSELGLRLSRGILVRLGSLIRPLLVVVGTLYGTFLHVSSWNNGSEIFLGWDRNLVLVAFDDLNSLIRLYLMLHACVVKIASLPNVVYLVGESLFTLDFICVVILSLGVKVRSAVFQDYLMTSHFLLMDFSMWKNLTSLPLHSTVRESPSCRPLLKRATFPDRVLSDQRLSSRLASSQTALKKVGGFFVAVLYRSTFEECKSSSFAHSDPIENIVGVHRRCSMSFEGLSCFSYAFVFHVQQLV